MKWKIGGERKGHLSNTYCVPCALYIIMINTRQYYANVIILFFLMKKKKKRNKEQWVLAYFGFYVLNKES